RPLRAAPRPTRSATPPAARFPPTSSRHLVSRRLLLFTMLLELAGKHFDELLIELRARAALELAHRDLVRQRLAVGAVRRHRVVGVGDGDDAPEDRDPVADQAARI